MRKEVTRACSVTFATFAWKDCRMQLKALQDDQYLVRDL